MKVRQPDLFRVVLASMCPDGLVPIAIGTARPPGFARPPGVIVVVERSRDHHTYDRHRHHHALWHIFNYQTPGEMAFYFMPNYQFIVCSDNESGLNMQLTCANLPHFLESTLLFYRVTIVEFAFRV